MACVEARLADSKSSRPARSRPTLTGAKPTTVHHSLLSTDAHRLRLLRGVAREVVQAVHLEPAPCDVAKWAEASLREACGSELAQPCGHIRSGVRTEARAGAAALREALVDAAGRQVAGDRRALRMQLRSDIAAQYRGAVGAIAPFKCG